MIIQGTPEILRGPRGLNGFGDFGAVETQISDDAYLEFMKSPEFANWAKSIPNLVLDYTTTYDSPIFGPQPGGTFGPAKDAAYQAYISRGGAAPVLTDAVAVNLMYQASTGGVSQIVLDSYGGYAVVSQKAQSAGFTATPQNIQAYEMTNNLPESAYTILNKQFIGAEGKANYAQFEANLSSLDEAVAAQALADLAAKSAAADAAYAAGEAARKKVISDAYAAAQAAARTEEQTRTAAAAAARQRALAAVKAIYLQVLQREGDDAGLNYFADRFGEVVDPDELQIFSDMAQPEIKARNKYLADMAATAKMLADSAASQAAAEVALAALLAADAARATAVVDKAVDDVKKTVTEVKTGTSPGITPIFEKDPTRDVKTGTTGGINPALILAAAAAAFFIGG